MKKCIICSKEKPLDAFYKHKEMVDGHLNKCKECCKKQSRERNAKKSNDPDWVEKERARGREKYARLNYKEKQKEYDSEKEWKNTSTYKNLSRNLNIPKGIHAHHWNYFKLKDVVLMEVKDHKAFHKLIELDIKKRIFKVIKTGEYLDTREKHLGFIISSGFKYKEYSNKVDYKL